MKNDVELSNGTDRKYIIKKTFVVKVSYPSWMETPAKKINERFLLNKVTGKNTLIECEVTEEVRNDKI